MDVIPQDTLQKPTAVLLYSFLGTAILAGLFIISRLNFLLFHGLAELFSIAVAWSVFLLVWNARRIARNDALLFLGIAYFFIGLIDLVHTLAYKGTGFFAIEFAANHATQLWISARSVEALSLLMYPLLLRRRIHMGLVFAGYTGMTAVLMLAIFAWNIFPVCYIDGVGLTAFKKGVEYVICLVLACAIFLLTRKREWVDADVYRLMIWAMIITIAAELAFTFYVGVYGISNVIGHFCKIASFFLVYIALIRSTFLRPYTTLFQELEQERKALEESETFTRTVMDHLPIGLAVNTVEPTVDFIYMNDNFPKFYRTPREALATSDAFWDAVYEDPVFREEIKKKVLEDCASGDPARMRWDVIPITRKGETTVFISARNTPVPGKSLMISTVWDVTDRIRMEQALRESEEKFRNIFNNTSDAIFIHDINGRFLEANNTACKRLGYTREELLRMSPMEIDAPEFSRKAHAQIQTIQQEGWHIYESAHRRKNGPPIPVEINSRMIEYEGTSCILSVARDITERKQAEEKLLEKMDALQRF